MRFYLSFLCILVLACTGCGDSTTTTTIKTSSLPSASKAPKPPASSNLDVSGTALVTDLITKYYSLKDALVATRDSAATNAATQLVVMAGVLHRYLESDTAHGKALMPYVDTIVTQGRAIPALHDATCEKQRIAFGHISSAIYGLAKASGLKNAGAYREYCPMAFNDKGAYWLSNDAEIKNPYFGKKMLECGEVTDSL